jgi:hypothetical protein
MSKEFKVGCKVFDLRYGNGKVTNISEGLLVCKFEGLESSCTYSIDGFAFHKQVCPMLYHGHDLTVEIKEQEFSYQVAYRTKNGGYQMSSTYHKDLDSFFKEYPKDLVAEIYEPSKRLISQ